MILRELYYDPKKGFKSAESIHRKLKETGYEISLAFIKNWLKTQETFSIHKRAFKRFKFSKTYVDSLAQQFQIDLVDMRNILSQNKPFNWIITGIEILSRFEFAIGIKSKKGEDTSKGLELILKEFLERFGKYPDVIQFNDANEFHNKMVYQLLREKKINWFSLEQAPKSGRKEYFPSTYIKEKYPEKEFIPKKDHERRGKKQPS